MFWGVVLIIVGVLILLQKIGLFTGISFWGYIWPVLIIAIGVKLIANGGKQSK